MLIPGIRTKKKDKKSTKLIVMLVIFLLSLVATANEITQYTEVHRLGTSQALCRGGVQSDSELQAFFVNNTELIKSILKDAHWTADPLPLFAAIAAGDFIEEEYAPGSTFEWMGMKLKGRPQALPKRLWAGKEPFVGYEVNLTQGCVDYQIVIPKICCNISLAIATSFVEKPELSMLVDGNSMLVCTDSWAVVTLTNPDGINRELTLNNNACWVGMDLPPGVYKAQSTGECGSVSEAAIIAQTSARKAIDTLTDSKKNGVSGFIAPLIGTETLMRYESSWDMDMRDSSGLIGVRLGNKLPLGGSLFLVPVLGFVHRTSVNDGNVYQDEGISLDIGVEKMITKSLFIGAGIGEWNIDDSDNRQESAFLKIGGLITQNLVSQSAEWFIEARGVDSDSAGYDGINDNHVYIAGYRFLF